MYDHGAVLQRCAIAEGSQFNWRTQEKDLVTWWLRQAEQTGNLKTVDGERLIVLDAGKRNDGPGPDVFQSRIVLDDFEMSGAVEMHMRAGDWYVHGHQYDNRYQTVILHVIMEGNTGPDIPTLRVDKQYLGAGRCISNRRIMEGELLAHAYLRFKSKQEHVRMLGLAGRGYDPLFLGMIEIIMAGASRHQQLHQAGLLLGMEKWPDNRMWQGSNLSFPKNQTKDILLRAVRQNIHLFEPQFWQSLPQDSWNTWNAKFFDFHKIGLSRNQCREWLINVVAPYLGEQEGFSFWRGMPIFRHYGLEQKMLRRLGVLMIGTVAEQQGLLRWKNIFCDNASCSTCPLTQYHHTLTQLN